MLSKQKINPRASVKSPDDEIVISGVSGRFPRSDNMDELAFNLYNKVNMLDDEEIRWRHTNPVIPKYSGKVRNIEKFDASFFGIRSQLAHIMDPQTRCLLEHAYEAALDAGINPKTLKGAKCGVYIGMCYSENEKIWYYEKETPEGMGMSGNARALIANRVSFALGLTGPSMILDSACSSSMYALDLAYSAMKNGEIDSAFVGCSNLLLRAEIALQFAKYLNFFFQISFLSFKYVFLSDLAF
jgi:fatty acid synthase, animal type